MSEEMRRRRTENTISDSDDNYDPWISVIGKVTYAVLAHPVDYAKTLMQIGFEPLAPVPSHTLFRRPVLQLPGIITYMGYIRRVDGILGLYRGLVPSITGRLVHDSCFNFVMARSPPIASFEEDQAIATDSEKILNFVKRTSQQSIAYIAAITVSQPFRVISIRMMAQFIGRETKYNALSSLIDIYREEGLSGLFAGLLPRIYGDTLRIWLAATATFFITNFVIQDKQTNHYVSAFCSLVASAWTYPFLLVSTVMSVSGAPIAAGGPPHVAVYCNWTQCYTHLKRHEQLKRGSSLFWRYHYPIKVSQGIAYKTDVDISSLD